MIMIYENIVIFLNIKTAVLFLADTVNNQKLLFE